jgi:hypothetical protein
MEILHLGVTAVLNGLWLPATWKLRRQSNLSNEPTALKIQRRLPGLQGNPYLSKTMLSILRNPVSGTTANLPALLYRGLGSKVIPFDAAST